MTQAMHAYGGSSFRGDIAFEFGQRCDRAVWSAEDPAAVHTSACEVVETTS